MTNLPSPALLTVSPQGIYCPAGDFYLDPVKAVRSAVVSHAHSDHAAKGHGTVYCTAPTADFMKLKARHAGQYKIQKTQSAFMINGIRVEFLDAGHVLGSVQVLIHLEGHRCLYTGDFKLQADATCDPYRFTRADVLVTESTFAHPATLHPDPVEEIKKLGDYADRNIILAAYPLGKAQRLTRLLTDHCPDKTVFIHPSIRPLHRLYEQYGMDPGNWQPFSTRKFRGAKNSVYIVPPNCFQGYHFNRKYHLAFASGWKRLQKNCDIELFISDHADWNDILKVIETTQPASVLTVHGDGSHLSTHFKDSGIEVSSLT